MIKLNDQKIEIQEFPNGERNIKTQEIDNIIKSTIFDKQHKSSHYNITLNYESDLDIVDLIMIKKHLDSKEYLKRVMKVLNLKYVPYSRMDRTEGKYVFTLKYLADIINSLGFDKVYIYDAHSDVSLALFNNIEHISVIETKINDIINKVKIPNKPLYVVIPDLGASKRYKKIFDITKTVGIAGIIVMDKVRDFATGQIKSIVPINKEVIRDKKFDILIVDDLCSFGGTFVGTFEVLKEYGCENANLFITHCENNITKGNVLKTFNQVFTTDSILDIEKVDNDDRNKITLI